MKRKKQYVWITVICSLIILASAVLGIFWNEAVYQFSYAFNDMRMRDIQSSDIYHTYYQETAQEMSETLLTYGLGYGMEGYTIEDDQQSNEIYQEAVDIYLSAASDLERGGITYYFFQLPMTALDSPESDQEEVYAREILSGDSSVDIDLGIMYDRGVVHEYFLNPYIIDYPYNYIASSQDTNYTEPNTTVSSGYDDLIDDLRIVDSKMTGSDSPAADYVHQIVEYYDHPMKYSYGYVVEDIDSTPCFTNANSSAQYLWSDFDNALDSSFVFMILVVLATGAVFILILNLTGILRRWFLWNAKLLYRCYLEIKILLWIISFILGMTSLHYLFDPYWYTNSSLVAACILALLSLIVFGALISDLYYNHGKVGGRNVIHKFYEWYKKHEQKMSFQKKMTSRVIQLIVFWAIAFMVGCIGVASWNPLIIWVAGIIGLVGTVIFCNKFILICRDLDTMTDKLYQIHQGNLKNTISVLPTSDLAIPMQWLDHLQDGIEQEVKTRLKSERMKVELITNVSHDLKTPLTSMINYIDLLEKEELNPEYANDYVTVLKKKIMRLKDMVEDVFDVAKANSGNLEFTPERIELTELMEQSLGENEQEIQSSHLEFRIHAPKKVYIQADGQKMWRVINNLISNTVKYSLAGTRVYIDILNRNQIASITIKNISNYEMTFQEDEIYERFKRGDESRSTEGSGLGLSIVSSFVALQGGTFRVAVDGDLFKAIVAFPALPDETDPPENMSKE